MMRPPPGGTFPHSVRCSAPQKESTSSALRGRMGRIGPRGARLAAVPLPPPRLPPEAARLHPWPSPPCGRAATVRRPWLAGSAKRLSRPVLRPGNARRNRTGTRRGRRRLVAMAASCLRRPAVPAEEEQPAPLSRRTAQRLRVGCWAEAASEVPTTSPVAINWRTARQQPNFTQASLFAGRHVAQSR